MTADPVTAWIGVGANLGDPAAAVRSALDLLGQMAQCQLTRQSSLYRSAPVGANTEGQPDYVNAVAGLLTTLPALELLDALFAVERRFGRTRSFRNAPRTLDLDLLLYGDEVIDMPALRIPHPRMHERAFVLLPLAEVAPTLHIPRLGSVESLLRSLDTATITRLPEQAHAVAATR